ncbi:MAG TPA: hypothetical protein VJ733_14950 [Candidatus Binatia bacterium]|nr:hypothetical protein [Candidatus Binatia bacterium]
MEAKPVILRELDDLPADAVREVIEFIRYVKKRRKTRETLSGREKDVARKQFLAIKKWAGKNLGNGFSGRDHDKILYGENQ